MIVLTRRTFLAGSTALAAAGLVPHAARAQSAKTYHALLIACTAYPNLPPKVALIGPNHDALLVREYLANAAPVKFAPENITLLADDLPEAAGPPSHEGIKAAFAKLAEKVEDGDFVYLHLSGHGAQQPQAKAGDESDGLDEIFLPRDTDKWVERDKGVPNALMDNEIGEALEAIRNKGAFVWAIFDCCHSATATRAADVGDEAERKVEFLDLVDEGNRDAAAKVYDTSASAVSSRGFDENGQRKPAFASLPTSIEPTAKGSLVAFYAAQSIETTPEMPLPKGAADATKYGLFTYTIFNKLAENPAVTYRQLGQAVLQQYSADGRTRPTPLFEGLLDARVFGSQDTGGTKQWPIKIEGSNITIGAGQLHRLSPGTKLAVLADPLDDLSAALGYLAVRSAKNLVSVLEPVEYNKIAPIAISAIPANAYARVAELSVDYKLAVARPGPQDGLDTEIALVNSVLDELVSAKDTGFNVALVESGQSADVRLAVMRENAIEGATPDAIDQPALWFLPASGDVVTNDGSHPPLIIIHTDDRPKFTENVASNLRTIFRATSLSRLAAASDYDAEEVSVEFRIKRVKTDTFETLVQASVPRVAPLDEVHLNAKNLSSRPVDLNVLYVGSDHSITHIIADRLVPGASREEGLLYFSDKTFGMERMIAVLTEAPPQSAMEDLSFLAQPGVPQKTRDVGDPSFSDLLLDVGLAPSTRSAMKLSGKGGSKGAVMIFPIETVKPTA